MDSIAIMTCLHGNEPFGLEVKRILEKNVPVFVGSPLAIEKNVRFVESDLNRVFPGKENGDYEEKRAREILNELKDFDIVIDVHSSPCEMPLFGIITKPNNQKIEFAKKLGLKKLIIMSSKLANGGALIDHVPFGISLEIGPHDRENNVKEVVDLINNFLNKNNKNNNMEIFEVFDLIKGEKGVKFFIDNFKEVKKGSLIARGKKEYFAEYDFVPVFVGRNSYSGILCLAAKKNI